MSWPLMGIRDTISHLRFHHTGLTGKLNVADDDIIVRSCQLPGSTGSEDIGSRQFHIVAFLDIISLSVIHVSSYLIY